MVHLVFYRGAWSFWVTPVCSFSVGPPAPCVLSETRVECFSWLSVDIGSRFEVLSCGIGELFLLEAFFRHGQIASGFYEFCKLFISYLSGIHEKAVDTALVERAFFQEMVLGHTPANSRVIDSFEKHREITRIFFISAPIGSAWNPNHAFGCCHGSLWQRFLAFVTSCGLCR